MDGQRVSLGCGTLILIALIVLIFSNAGRNDNLKPVLERLDKIERQLDDVQRELARLRQAP